MIMPDAWIVCAFLFGAGVALFFSPMPVVMRTIQALAFIYLGAIFFATSFGLTTSDSRSMLIRVGLIVLSAITIISIAAWRLAGNKVWRSWK